VSLRYIHDRGHVGRQAVHVNRQNSLGAWGYPGFDFPWIDVVGALVDVNPHNRSPGVTDSRCGGDIGIGYSDDLISWSHTAGEKAHQHGPIARASTYGIPHVKKLDELFFKGIHLIPVLKPTTLDHSLDSGIYLFL